MGKEDLSLLKRKIEWESDGTDDYGNQRVSVASFFDGCLVTLVDEVERTGSKLVRGASSKAIVACEVLDAGRPSAKNTRAPRPAAGFVTQGTARALLSWGLGLTRIVTSSRSV